MSDRTAETGFAPVTLAAAMARSSSFRPLAFSSSARAPQTADGNAAELDLDDPFARGLAEGQRVA